jgi:hypothetical protein
VQERPQPNGHILVLDPYERVHVAVTPRHSVMILATAHAHERAESRLVGLTNRILFWGIVGRKGRDLPATLPFPRALYGELQA